MVENRIIHGQIYLNKILIKYLDSEKKKYIYKLNLFSDPFHKIKTIHLNSCAPEILKEEVKGFHEKSDLWSLGILIYTLYFKKNPYNCSSKNEILEEIKSKSINKTKNSNLDDLINNLLVEDPLKRITWKNYFNHPFLRKNN